MAPFTFPAAMTAAQKNRCITALCAYYGYATNAQAGETQAQFANRMIVAHVLRITREYEANNAAATTAATTAAQTDADMVNLA